MGTQMSIHYIAAFIVSLFLIMPLLGIATSGVNESSEELESPANLSYTHTSSSMNEPGFQAGSIFTNSTIALGGGHACLITDDQVLRCWGENAYGQLGDGTQTDRNSIEDASLPLSELATISVATSAGSTCAILVNGSLYCWGYNIYGQVGDGTDRDRYTPTLIDIGLGRTAITISAGREHICVILDDASLKCWGQNGYGQLGLGFRNATGDTGIFTPQQVNLGNVTVHGITASDYHTCAQLGDGSIKCWGGNGQGQVGDGTTWQRDSPVSIDLGEGNTAVTISTSVSSSCALLQDGLIKCWGYGGYGVLGNGGSARQTSPESVSLPPGRTAIAISTGAISQHVCAILDNNSVYCWGYNHFGQVGDGTNTDRNTPTYVEMGGSEIARAVVVGGAMSCAILDDASLKCWGNIFKHTGDPSNVPISMTLPTGRHIDLSERDIDGDGILNIFDTLMPGDDGDADGDGIGNSIDTDDDNDGWSDYDEVDCGTDSLNSSSIPTDTDSDGICNSLDSDDDGDFWSDDEESACGTDSLNSSSIPADTDSDGICNSLDSDDGDGIGNNTDDDGGIGNNTDDDSEIGNNTDDDDGIGNNTDTIRDEVWLIGAIIIGALLLLYMIQSSRINELEKIITNSTTIEEIIEDDELSDN